MKKKIVNFRVFDILNDLNTIWKSQIFEEKKIRKKKIEKKK